jgi:hypothetical protein
VELPPVRATAEPAPANAPPAEVPAGPAYLAQAVHEPAAVPVAPAVILPLAVADLRPSAGGGAVNLIEMPVPLGPPAQAQQPMIAVADGAAVCVAVVPPPEAAPAGEAAPTQNKPKTERRVSAWRNGVAVGLALVFAERLIAARRGGRGERDRGQPVGAIVAPHIPAGA